MFFKNIPHFRLKVETRNSNFCTGYQILSFKASGSSRSGLYSGRPPKIRKAEGVLSNN